MNDRNLAVASVGFMSLLMVLSNSALATLKVDLRFSDGTKSKPAAAGTYAVDVWAQVTGNNALSDESLLLLWGSIQSNQQNGGVIAAGTSGVIDNQAGPSFTLDNPRGSQGTAQDITNDGIVDWGTTSTSNLNSIKYNTDFGDAMGVTFATATSPGTVTNLIGNGVEFKVGTFQVLINAADVEAAVDLDAVTTFNWVKGSGVIPPAHIVRLDGGAIYESNTSAYLASTSANAVEFTPSLTAILIPEPATVSLVGIAFVGLAGRRRASSYCSWNDRRRR